jgi:hypothetical protein
MGIPVWAEEDSSLRPPSIREVLGLSIISTITILSQHIYTEIETDLHHSMKKEGEAQLIRWV